MNDYGYDYASLTDSSAAAAVGGAFAGMYIVMLIVSVLCIVAMWKVFSKAGKPGWASIIPIYNIIVLFQIAGMNPLMILLELIPVANVIVLIMLYINLAKRFGKGGGFAAGLIFLNPIFMLILGFGSAEYQG